jgi:hypothetical protein
MASIFEDRAGDLCVLAGDPLAPINRFDGKASALPAYDSRSSEVTVGVGIRRAFKTVRVIGGFRPPTDSPHMTPPDNLQEQM